MPLFWLDVGAFAFSAIMALAMALSVLGSDSRRPVNRAFALYALTTGAMATLAMLLRLALWLGRGNPALLGRLATWSFAFVGPALLLFAAHYAGVSLRWIRWGVITGILWASLFVLPTVVLGWVVGDQGLDVRGMVYGRLTVLGLIIMAVPFLFVVWALGLLLGFRRRREERAVALSTVVLLAGIVVSGVGARFPPLSLTMGLSLLILGFGVLGRQLLNPLREHNVALEVEIAERRQAEAEARHLQEVLQAVADSMPAALLALDVEGRVLIWNPGAEGLTGVREQEVLGRRVWDVSPVLARYRAMAEAVAQDGVPARRREQTVELGHRRVRDVEIFPLNSGGVRGIVMRIRDVTRRVQMEEIAVQSAKMASVGGLAAGVAHELNNPLGAILQGLQMVDMAFDVDQPLTRTRLLEHEVDVEALRRYVEARDVPGYVQEMRAAAQRAARIVTELLGYSQSGGFELTTCDLNDLIRRTLDLAATDFDLRRQYDFRNIEIIWELDPDLPALSCDGPQIQQVILNLVRNAAQAMAVVAETRATEASPYRAQLTVRTERLPGAVRMVVEDNGSGVPEPARPHLFEPFFTTREAGEGAGLGLWLCWTIVVERHGGWIWAESEEGRGTRVVVELPLDAGGLVDGVGR